MPQPPKNVLVSKEQVGRRLRALRQDRGVTQTEAAKLLGIHQTNISAIERGVRGLTIHQLVKLSKALGVSADDILTGTTPTAAAKPLRSMKLLRRFKRIETMPEPRQRAVLRFLDALISEETHANGR